MSPRSVELHLAKEDLAHLLAVLVQRGRDDVRGLVVAELNDELSKIGLVRDEFPPPPMRG